MFVCIADVNVATLPDDPTTTITINNVNHELNQQWYVSNDGSNSNKAITFNGFTKLMKTQAVPVTKDEAVTVSVVSVLSVLECSSV